MNERLLIEGHKIDLTTGGIRRTLQINDVAEVRDRQASFSNTFTAPLTPNNVEVMDFLGVSGNNSLKPYRRLKAEYSFRGIPLVTNGYVVVKSTGAGYNMVLYNGVIDLAERIKGKKLSDLDFADLNHHLTTQTYINSQSNTSGYIYALGNFGYKFFNEIPVQHQAPSVFLSTIWAKIFKGAGLDYIGNFFTSNSDFKTEVMTPGKGYEVSQAALTETALGIGNTETIVVFKNSPTAITQEDQLEFDAENFTEITVSTAGELTADFAGLLNIDVTINFEVMEGSQVTFRTYLNGSVISYAQLYPNQNSETRKLNINVIAGDKLKFTVRGRAYTTDVGPERYILDYRVQADVIAGKKSGGQLIDFNLFVPEMDQSAFIKDVMQRYGLVLRPTKSGEGYEFKQFEELLNDKANAEDWSDILSELGGEDYAMDYAKLNKASYKYPSEASEFPYDGILEIDNENAAISKDLFSSPFEIAIKDYLYKGWPIYSVPIWEEKTEDSIIVKKAKENPAKIFRINRVTTSANVRLFDEASATGITEIPYLSLINMEMQYFININYKAFKSMIERTKKREAIFNLSILDLYELDFFKLKFLKQTGKYYYLNKLISEPGHLTPAELIQIDKFSVNSAPTTLGTYTINTTYNASTFLYINAFTTLTIPQWFDPEFDAAAAVKITGGFNTAVLFKDKNGVRTVVNEILAADFPVTFQDAGLTTEPHTQEFTFKVKDAGSGTYSTMEGKIIVNVSEYINTGPIANAGNDATVQMYDPTVDPNALPAYASLNGSNSTAPETIVSWTWVIISGPTGHTGTIYDADTTNPTAGLRVPAIEDNFGTYTIRLTVTDNLGATDSDTVRISVTVNNKPPRI